MSDYEEEDNCRFGTPLEPYQEDAFPKRRPIPIEDQVAKDAQGRRRFHGAFTGGFSAGFFNTVGSLEGWSPAEFKSSRNEKSARTRQAPQDFMDDEDLGEFGIAPQSVKATNDYATSKKRKTQAHSEGPIPGQPVLQTLLECGNETVGYFLLKNMNVKRRKKIMVTAKCETGEKVYGCEMPNSLEIEEVPVESQYTVPDIYKQYLSTPKSNTCGLGYSGLLQTHINLFQPSHLTVLEKNKKLSISGQAFGVGAFEDDDEDIYVKDDMSKYDYEMTSEPTKAVNKNQKDVHVILDYFVPAKHNFICFENFPLPVIPNSFTGKHNIRKSRFEPVPQDNENVRRKHMNPDIRSKYLGEETDSVKQNIQNNSEQLVKQDNDNVTNDHSVKTLNNMIRHSNLELITGNLLCDRFVSASTSSDHTNILEPVKSTETIHGSQEMRDAARMKMFGALTRINLTWQPCSLLCKRFNVPEPHFCDDSHKTKTRTKNLIFEYQKHADDTLVNIPGLQTFVTTNTSNIPPPDVPIKLTTIIGEENPDSDCVTNNTNLSLENNSSDNANKDVTENATQSTDKVNVDRNLDLFKAVFLSSSESESEDVEENDNNRNEMMKNSILNDQLIPTIKPIKEGLLSNLSFSSTFTFSDKITDSKDIRENDHSSVNCNVSENSSSVQVDSDTYGPKLPEKKIAIVKTTASEIAEQHDEWVEKALKKTHKHKDKKEKKKEKHKRSKHKHKDKRK